MSQKKSGPTLDDLDVLPTSAPEAPAAPAAPAAKKTTSKKPKETWERKGEKCWEVEIPDKARDEDLDYVPVGVNGEVLQLRRGDTVIIPQRFLGALDDAVQPVYKKDPNDGDRKKVTTIRKINYRKNRQATWEEYEKKKQEGRLSNKRLQ